jgi:hypothetical protein
MQEITRNYTNGFAVLVVSKLNGEVICATDHFVINSYNESDQERTSVHYTAGDPTMYVGRGRRPMMNTYSGVLTDTDTNGKMISAWLYAYERYLRGTRCVRNQAVVEIMIRDLYRKGYLVSTKIDYSADNQNRAVFSFGMFVIDKGVARWRRDLKASTTPRDASQFQFSSGPARLG